MVIRTSKIIENSQTVREANLNSGSRLAVGTYIQKPIFHYAFLIALGQMTQNILRLVNSKYLFTDRNIDLFFKLHNHKTEPLLSLILMIFFYPYSI